MSQSVRPPPAARAFQLARVQCTDTEQDSLWDLLLGPRQLLDYQVSFCSPLCCYFFKYNIYIVCIYIFIFFISFFFNSEIKKQPAVMARDPEHVSKLTESTFKVSDTFNI